MARQEETSPGLHQRYGWKAFVTKARPQRLSLEAAVLCYRHAYRVARVFNRLKSRRHIAPRLVTLNDPIEGLPSLLTLGVRV
jgi:transposase